MKVRVLAVVVIALFLYLGWDNLISKSDETERIYEQALQEARNQADLGINEKAFENYKSALAQKESFELRCEIVEFLKNAGAYKSLEKEYKSLLEMYPKEAKTYEYLCSYAAETGEIWDLYDNALLMKNRGVSSELVEQLKYDHRYDYEIQNNGYIKIDPYMYGYAKVYSNDGRVGFLDAWENQVVSAIYNIAAPYSDIGYFAVQDSNGELIFIDMDGVKTYVDSQKRNMVFEDVQGFASGMMSVKQNGYYRYIDSDYNDINENKKFNFAGMFNENRAAVKTDAGWFIIDEKLEQVSPVFEEIKLTENNIAVISGRCVIKKDNTWYLADENGNIVVQQGYEDICPPLDLKGEGAIAVKKGGKWGFIDKNGNTIIDFKYDNARSFCGSFAAVAREELWTVIDNEGKELFEPKFLAILEMSVNGKFPVLTDKGWGMITFYSMRY